jgi:F0F1-type ATP synthase, subunit b
MPQFEIATFSAQIFWLLISFTILMAYCVFVSVPKIKAILEERWHRTEGYQIEAKQLTQEATAVTALGAEHLKRTREKAHEIIMEAQKQATAATLEKKSAFMAQFNHQIHEADQRLASEKEHMLQELSSHIETLSSQIMAKLVNSPLHGQQQERQQGDQAADSTQTPQRTIHA